MQNYLYENISSLHVHFHANQTYFHMKGFARGLVLKRRHEITTCFSNVNLPTFNTPERFRCIFKIAQIQVNVHIVSSVLQVFIHGSYIVQLQPDFLFV